MAGTPEALQAELRAYFQATNRKSYLENWSGRALSFHLGIADESTRSLDEAHENANRLVADRLDIRNECRVLDAGCGVGGTSIWLARERGARVTGITLDPEQVELANQFAVDRGVADRVSFALMDYAATNFAPGSFDVVLNLESLCHAADPRAYLAHALTLLRRGGKLGCLDYFRGETASVLVDETCRGWVLPSLRTLGGLAEDARAAGFDSVETVDETHRVQLSASQMRAMARNTALLFELGRASNLPPDGLLEAHVRAANAAAEALMSGALRYGYVQATKP